MMNNNQCQQAVISFPDPQSSRCLIVYVDHHTADELKLYGSIRIEVRQSGRLYVLIVDFIF